MSAIKHHHFYDAITYTAHIFRESHKKGYLRFLGAKLTAKAKSPTERYWLVSCQRIVTVPDAQHLSARYKMNCRVRVDLLKNGNYQDNPSYYPYMAYNGIISTINICDNYLLNRQEIVKAQLVDTLFMEEAHDFKWWYVEYLCTAADGTLFTQGIHIDTATGMLFDLTQTVKRKSVTIARSD